MDGLEGVQTFETDGHFEYGNSCPPMGSLDADCCFPHFHCSVVLVDLSMPILDGVGATARMREIEGEGTKHQFVNTSNNYVPFGVGRHAW